MGVISISALEDKAARLVKEEDTWLKAWLYHYRKQDLLVLSHDHRDMHRHGADRYWREYKRTKLELAKVRALLRARRPRHTLVGAR